MSNDTILTTKAKTVCMPFRLTIHDDNPANRSWGKEVGIFWIDVPCSDLSAGIPEREPAPHWELLRLEEKHAADVIRANLECSLDFDALKSPIPAWQSILTNYVTDVGNTGTYTLRLDESETRKLWDAVDAQAKELSHWRAVARYNQATSLPPSRELEEALRLLSSVVKNVPIIEPKWCGTWLYEKCKAFVDKMTPDASPNDQDQRRGGKS